MIPEWLERLFTPCPIHLREMGLVRELFGIRRRFRRYRQAWAPHCERSRALVRAAAARCPARDRCVVIGSSWLHDVPLEELASSFREVALIDLVHPPTARWQARRHANVQLLSHDVTGTLEQVWAAGQTRGPLPRARPELPGGPADLVVSLNLLSQLPCLPESYLKRRRSHPPAEVAALCRHLVQAHLELLRRAPGVVTLISDRELRVVSATGEELSRQDTLYGVAPALRGEEWDWSLVPPAPGRSGEVLRVVGVADLNALVRA